MLTSMGYSPAAFTEDEQLLLLCRLLPLVQKSMHMMELAPKGTGKSYVYENISPRVRLISGGNVSPAVLFVNNMTGQWGFWPATRSSCWTKFRRSSSRSPKKSLAASRVFFRTAADPRRVARDCQRLWPCLTGEHHA